MNHVALIGRLVRNPDVKYMQNEKQTCIAKYTLAVDRRFKRDGEQTADFISCVAYGSIGEFAEKYLQKGTKIAVTGRIQTGSYTNRDGNKVYTTDVVVESQEFVESKSSASQNHGETSEQKTAPKAVEKAPDDDFMKIDDGVSEELPFA